MQPIPDVTIPAPIPDATQTQINDLLTQLETLLAPYLRSLTDDQRRGLAKMGNDSVEFVRNGQNAIGVNEDYMPRSFDDTTFNNAFALATQLASISQRLDALARGADDGDMLFGSVAYSDALEIYAQLGRASQSNSQLLPFYDAMKVRFDKLRGKRTPAPATA